MELLELSTPMCHWKLYTISRIVYLVMFYSVVGYKKSVVAATVTVLPASSSEGRPILYSTRFLSH